MSKLYLSHSCSAELHCWSLSLSISLTLCMCTYSICICWQQKKNQSFLWSRGSPKEWDQRTCRLHLPLVLWTIVSTPLCQLLAVTILAFLNQKWHGRGGAKCNSKVTNKRPWSENTPWKYSSCETKGAFLMDFYTIIPEEPPPGGHYKECIFRLLQERLPFSVVHVTDEHI